MPHWLSGGVFLLSQPNDTAMLNFKVTLSHMDNQDRFKFVTVGECKDMDECLEHIWETEKGWVIDAIKRI